jgi:L-rhamnose mutarotase
MKEIISCVKDTGIENKEICYLGERLFMIMKVNDDFSFANRQQTYKNNVKLQESEELRWKYQRPLE